MCRVLCGLIDTETREPWNTVHSDTEHEPWRPHLRCRTHIPYLTIPRLPAGEHLQLRAMSGHFLSAESQPPLVFANRTASVCSAVACLQAAFAPLLFTTLHKGSRVSELWRGCSQPSILQPVPTPDWLGLEPGELQQRAGCAAAVATMAVLADGGGGTEAHMTATGRCKPPQWDRRGCPQSAPKPTLCLSGCLPDPSPALPCPVGLQTILWLVRDPCVVRGERE